MIGRDSSQAFRMTSRDFCDWATVPEPSELIRSVARPLLFRREQFRFSFYRALTSACPRRASRHRVCRHHYLVDRCLVRAAALGGGPRSR